MGKFRKNLTGKQFNRLTCIKYVGNSKWLCKCECGKETVVLTRKIITGHTKSCGCLKDEVNLQKAKIMQEANKKYKNLKYDEKYKRLLRIWYDMIARCKDKNNKIYGGKGIKVCEEWQNFENFYNWSKEKFNENIKKRHLQLDRINNDGNYEPNNCRFISMREQQWNKSNNFLVEYEGQIRCLAEWAYILNLKYGPLHHKIKNKKMTIEQILKGELV